MSSHPLEGLKFVREELNVPATELAKLIGVMPSTYYRYENGTRRSYWDQIDTIATFLGVPHAMLKRIPTGSDLVTLVDMARNRRVATIEQPAAVLQPRPTITIGGGLTAVTRPMNDTELRQRLGHDDISAYLPWTGEHQPELDALARAGEVMDNGNQHIAADGTDITDLVKEWSEPE